MGTIVDSSILIAALHETDSQHERGLSVLKEAARPIIIPEYIVAETATMLMIRKQKHSADQFVQEVLRSGEFALLPSSPLLFDAAAKLFLATSKKLSFVDCALLALSHEYAVLTFDVALAKAIHAAERQSPHLSDK